MAVALGSVCALQKQYGKSAAELKTLVEGFAWVLSHVPVEKVLEGIKTYIQRKPDIPAPADILNIIDPVFTPNWSAFTDIRKRMCSMNQYVSRKERDYVEECLQWATTNNQPMPETKSGGRDE